MLPRLRWIVALALPFVPLAACAGETEESRGDRRGDSTPTTTVTILDPNFEVIFNPSWSMPARFLVFSPLVAIDAGGEIEPRLARSWEHSDDYREWTFHLRTDVRWHDGVPFTARDVAFTQRRMSPPEGSYYTNLDTAVVVDDSTITLRGSEPWNALDYWGVYYPEHLLEDVPPGEFFDAEFWTRPVGTGPYRYVRHEPRTVFELEANPEYYRGRPSVDRLRIKFGGGSPLAELRSGNVDAAVYVDRANVPRYREDPRFRLYHSIAPLLDWLEVIFWNQRHPLVGDARVRRALTLALDRREVRRLQQLPEGLPLFDVVPTMEQFRGGDLPAPLPHDPDSARTLLTAAGWRDTDADGVRERGGTEARFSALVDAGGGTNRTETAAVYAQEAFRQVGVAMEIRRQEAGLRRRIRAGEFDASFHRLSRWNLERWFGPDSPLGDHERELVRIFGAMDTIPDPAVQDSLIRLTWPIFQREVPVTILGPNIHYFVAHRHVRGLESPFRAHPYMAAGELWIEERPHGR